ncbi:MAG: DEAD/DEAH box helicase family protein [bacterium]|nr:DEAD/DEAH box helicase family protein [bacterium]
MKFALERHPGEYGPARFEAVWFWIEWPDRLAHGYGPDFGIDLVARQTEAYGGGLCAIQAKFYDDGRIDHAAVAKFLAASDAAEFESRLLVVTGRLTEHAQTLVSKASPRCEVLHGSHVESWPVRWQDFLDAPESLRFEPEPFEPYPFQRTAVDKVVAGFERHDRGRLILPCGTGKSVVALWIAERMAGRGGRVLYLVPSIALMGQTMRHWAQRRNPQIAHRYIGICSDTKAGKTAEDAHLAELAMPVTTDPERIGGQLSLDHPDDMTVVFCTYQSLPLVTGAQRIGAPAFDLVVCDEAHRTTGVAAGDWGSHFTLVHDGEAVLARKRLYMTATPRLYTEAVKSKAAERNLAGGDIDVFSMDDEERYGPEFFGMGFAEAVEGGYLTDYQVVVIAIAEDLMIDRIDGLTLPGGPTITTENAVRLLGCWDALADPTTKAPGERHPGTRNRDDRQVARRAIAFTNTIRASQRVETYWGRVIEAATPLGAGGADLLACAVQHTDGKKNALDRARVIAWLQDGDPAGGCRIVTNARCLTEGVDVPALDAVLFIEPKGSQTDVVQAVGRVMRRSEGKELGYVVLPAVVPTGQRVDDILDGGDFKQVWGVLKALRSHDGRLDVALNTADLTGRLPMIVIPTGLCDACGGAGCDGGDECDPPIRNGDTTQLRLPFDVGKICSKLVEQCGDRQYWGRWGEQVARVTATIAERIEEALRTSRMLDEAFERFCEDMQATVGAHLTHRQLVSMLAQHIVTVPVFDALFSESGFADRNPMSKALNELLDEFKSHEVRLTDETRDLQRFYQSVRDRLSGADDSETRLKVLLEVYETFFATAMPDDVKRLGIVYTPVELVDFILRSTDAVLRAEFGRGLTDEGVHILDPFTGTGTFINRLLTQRGTDGEYLIRDEDLARKFGSGLARGEIHANEIVLLAYYLAAIKIEEAYNERTGGYEPFEGIVLTDTFLMADDDRLPGIDSIRRNSDRARRQNKLPIQVIVGNPPWSAGKKAAGDDTSKIAYEHMEMRVGETYSAKHRDITGRGAGKSAGNTYVQAVRWACDRLNQVGGHEPYPGVVAFIHPNSLGNATSLAGMRATLRDEFADIYVVNLRGDARKAGDEFAREGAKIFGGGATVGVQITVLVRNPLKGVANPATLHYAEVPERSSLEAKFGWLHELGDVTSEGFEEVPINDSHDWINQTDGSFETLLPVCRLAKQATGEELVSSHALGVATNCDVYVYSFSRDILIQRVRSLIDANELARELHELGEPLEAVTGNDYLNEIKWTDTLKQSLKRGHRIEFDEARIREVLYRPFTKLWLYEDDRILSSVKTISRMFPRDTADPTGGGLGQPHPAAPVRGHGHRPALRPLRHRPADPLPTSAAILMAGPSNMALFGVLAGNRLPDLHLMGPGQQTRAIPRWRRSS